MGLPAEKEVSGARVKALKTNGVKPAPLGKATGHAEPHPDMRTETEFVTPAMAASWLTRNKINRPLRQHVVERIAWDIVNEAWELNEESIAFDKDGDLVQGQHRLTAIVEAGVGVWMRVTRNAPGIWAIRDRADPRRTADFLQWTDGDLIESSTAPKVAAMCNALELLRARGPIRPSVSRVRDILATNEEGLRWASGTVVLKRYPCVVAAAFAYAHRANPEKVEEFADAFITGVNLPEGSPVLALKSALGVQRTNNTTTKIATMLRVLGALRAFIVGRNLTKVEAADGHHEWFRTKREEQGVEG